MTYGVLQGSKRSYAGAPGPLPAPDLPHAEPVNSRAEQQIALGCMSKWALWPSINDEWLPQQQPRTIFHLLAIQTSSSKAVKSQAWRGRVVNLVPGAGETLGAQSVGLTWFW